MGLPPSPAMLLLAVIAIGLAYKFRAARSRSHTLPPGPKPWPLLGNALQVSLEYMHHTFSEWRQRYGTSVPTTINVPRARGDSSPVEDLPGWLKNALPASLSRVRQTQNERLRRMAKEEWKASPRAERMDRIDPEMPSKKYGKLAEKLPRRQASILIQLRTEHIPLQKFLFRIQKEDTPICPSCRTTRETVYHYLMECPAFNEQRDQLARDAGPAARSIKDLLSSASTMRPLFRYIHSTGRFAAAYGDLEIKDEKARDRAKGAR